MKKEYLKLEKVEGPLIVLSGITDAAYGETVNIKVDNEETRKELYKEQKRSGTIVKDEKVYPNDPCPCGSGKKYKQCCGK